MARIVLIYPRFEPTFWGFDYAMPIFHFKSMFPPINLTLLAALTPAEHSVVIIDENVEPIDFERCRGADIVGITGMNIQRDRMREILLELRRRGHFTIVGGPCVTVDAPAVSDLADVTFIGEAEVTWPRFLAEWKEGRHQSRYEQEDKTDMTTVPRPRLDLLKMNKYLCGSLQISRGCPFTCEFCDIIVVFGRRPRLKTSAQVIAELDGLVAAGKDNIFIVDDNLIGNKKAIKPILREIIAWQRARGYPVTLWTEASIDLAEDAEMLELLAEANFEAIFVGIESTNEESLRETKKIQNLTDRSGTVLEKVHRIQQAGIEVLCGMIVGFDNDDQTVFAAHRQFLAQSRVIMAIVNVLTAIPKTPLYTRLMKEGRLDEGGDKSKFSTTSTNVVPLRMSRRTLCDGFIELLRHTYSPEVYFARTDALYLEGNFLPSKARTRYLRQHTWAWFKKKSRHAAETLAMFIELMRLVPDKELRREYRRRLWNVMRQRPQLDLLRAYCFKCITHFHFSQIVRKTIADYEKLARDLDRSPQPKPVEIRPMARPEEGAKAQQVA